MLGIGISRISRVIRAFEVNPENGERKQILFTSPDEAASYIREKREGNSLLAGLDEHPEDALKTPGVKTVHLPSFIHESLFGKKKSGICLLVGAESRAYLVKAGKAEASGGRKGGGGAVSRTAFYLVALANPESNPDESAEPPAETARRAGETIEKAFAGDFHSSQAVDFAQGEICNLALASAISALSGEKEINISVSGDITGNAEFWKTLERKIRICADMTAGGRKTEVMTTAATADRFLAEEAARRP